MRTLGLIGGMSWESSALYYRDLNRLTRERRGGLHSAPLVLWSVDFAAIAELQRRGDWAAADRVMVDAARRLEGAGAEALVICTNTMHRCAPAVEAAVGIPLLHIADATAAAIRASSSRRPILLGTRFTMEQDFYAGRLRERHGIDVLVPDADDRAEVNQVIYDELCRGEICEPSRRRYLDLVARLRKAGGDGVILGCTEIGLLIGQADLDVPAFDTVALHVEAAFAWAAG